MSPELVAIVAALLFCLPLLGSLAVVVVTLWWAALRLVWRSIRNPMEMFRDPDID